METKTYNPDQVSLIVGGSIIKSWNKVVVGRDEDSWSFSAGTSGEATRTKNLNTLGAIKITLPQTSQDNGVLSAYEKSDALLSCVVKDSSGYSLYAMPEGTVIRQAGSEFGKESGEREWTLKGALAEFTVGGN
ncbi:hypothetical protein DSCW_18160 [Desulfosarcina widdelii]|uniref:Uncharacterized protein n=1 Tax=Desulfosarcina widdelii TaxID=947919 RepID=A0A5K7Z2B2_9BACT|nr:hypothetical protein [Desulfosarcina widdelii]BBO74399.1 hypothetical protein DSCW_18160 [Desulfosarcina widdelii]